VALKSRTAAWSSPTQAEAAASAPLAGTKRQHAAARAAQRGAHLGPLRTVSTAAILRRARGLYERRFVATVGLFSAAPLHAAAPSHISDGAMSDFPRKATTHLGLAVAAASLTIVAALLWYMAARQPRPVASVSPATAAAQVDFAFARLARPREFPPLRFTAASGRQLTLADFRGKAVLLNLWATWCAPCRKEMPTLDRLQKKLGGGGFQVVALSIDRLGLGAVAPFYKKLGLGSLGIYLDPSGEAATALDLPGLPTSFLIDAEGREIARKVGPARWDSPAMVGKIERYLKSSGRGRRGPPA
jgi:thiol-disulfide isomerase/thioredoxin